MSGNQQRKLVVENVSANFANFSSKSVLRVLDKITFVADDGEFICFVGPSGCGKTTLLNILAGFEPVQTGKVFYNGSPIEKPSSERAVVFQSPVLFPWLTVRKNVIYGLKRSGISKSQSVQMVKDYLHMVKMDGFENYFPQQLSGGMQHRVALARALILKPRVLLMDEPFAALDAQTRLTMQELLMDIRQSLTTTVIMVTHDVEEALYLADRVLVMSKRPAMIISEITVPFTKPRTLSLRGTPSFAALKAEILKMITAQAK